MRDITCRYHPHAPASYECAGCHKRFCSECVKEGISGQYYCDVCQHRMETSNVVFCRHCLPTEVLMNSGKLLRRDKEPRDWYGSCPVCHCQWSLWGHWIRASHDCAVARQKRGLLTSVRLFLVRCFLYFMWHYF